jgi:hypothetical protein
VIAVEWGSDRSQTAAGSKAESFLRLAGDPDHADPVKGGRMAHSLRSTGSAALNFSMVAQGGMDMYWYVFVMLLTLASRYLKDRSVQGNRLLVGHFIYSNLRIRYNKQRFLGHGTSA